jgi:hypothetical protein
MQVNGQKWEPTQIGQDPCQRTFQASWSEFSSNGVSRQYYDLVAHKDPQAVTSHLSENTFRLRIFDVPEIGRYPILGVYREPRQSSVAFGLRKPTGEYALYVNKRNDPAFVVVVTDVLYIPPGASVTPRLRGTFSGTLYNEQNPQDSLHISEGTFSFRKMNRNTFNQCPD